VQIVICGGTPYNNNYRRKVSSRVQQHSTYINNRVTGRHTTTTEHSEYTHHETTTRMNS
jgi:hypothetical protein